MSAGCIWIRCGVDAYGQRKWGVYDSLLLYTYAAYGYMGDLMARSERLRALGYSAMRCPADCCAAAPFA